MEENFKIVELKGLTNQQLIQQFLDMIGERQVEQITFFISFKCRFEKSKPKTEKNLQQKTYDALNHQRQRRHHQQLLQNLKVTVLNKNKVQQTFCDKINKLYEEGEYQKILTTLIPKQKQFLDKQNSRPGVTDDEKMRKNNDYNFITFSIGNCYFRLKNHDLASQYYQKHLPLQSPKQHAQRLNNLGTCFAIKCSYQQALKSYNEAIRFYNESSIDDVSSILNNIAMIYLKCQMYKTAQQFFQESIKERKQKSPNNKIMLYSSYYNLGICQKKCGKVEESLNNLFVAWSYASDGVGKKIDVLNQICLVYQRQEKWVEALSYYEKLSDQYQELKKPQGSIYERVSKIHGHLGNTLMAAKFAKKAYKLYFEQGNQRKLSQLSGSPYINMQNTF